MSHPFPVLTPELAAKIKEELKQLGVQGSSLQALPLLEKDVDFHHTIRTVLLTFLQALFKYANPEYAWDADPANTKVFIYYADPRNVPEPAAGLPSITLELAPFTWAWSSIGQLLGGLRDGTMFYTDLLNGSAIIRCRSSVRLEADALAAFVGQAVTFFRIDLQKALGAVFLGGHNINNSVEDRIPNPLGQAFVAHVVVPINFQVSWAKQPSRQLAPIMEVEGGEDAIPFD
jgi:hypothetical protein